MSTGFTLGGKTTAPPAFGTGSITFGTPSTQTPSTFGFGTVTTASQPAPGFQFGSTAAPASTGSQAPLGTAAAATATGLSFGLGTATTAPALPFGVATTTTAPTSLSGGLFGATTATPGLTFGTSSGTPGLGLGTTTTTTSTGLTFGLGGSTSQPLNLASTTTPATVGLGGTATTQAKLPTQKEVPPKEQLLPNEILQTVDQFKEMVKQQKIYSSDIARCSVRDFRKVEQEIDQLTNLLNEVESQLQKNRYMAEQLKYDTAMCLQNVEMAQRTQDIPPGLQYEHTAPLRYFLQLADQFETDMQVLKFQIECADKYVKNHRSPDVLTPQDLSLGMRRLHETFVALAGRLQSVHSQVESQKEMYLNIRKQICNDHSNPFEKLTKPSTAHTNPIILYHPKVATGPTPFSNLVLGNGNPLILQQQNQTNPYMGPGATTPQVQTGFGSMTFGTQSTAQPVMTGLLGSSMFGQTPFNTSSNFQLQKPPTGNKRGKQ